MTSSPYLPIEGSGDYLTETSLADFLYGRFPDRGPFEVRRLAGGVSSLVFLCEGRGGMRLVVKQSLEYLTVAEEWKAPRERILVEVEAMNALEPTLPEGCVPPVYFVQERQFAYGMGAVPPDANLFKQALLEGNWHEEWFASAGALLASIHRESAKREADFREKFRDQSLFDALRLDPYFRFAAKAHPDLAGQFDRAITIAKSDARCLVHGDYSPKNIFVRPATGQLILLDYEAAHWGNPAFDLGFFLTHPLAKGIHFPNGAARFAQAIRAFADSYFAHCGPHGAREAECLLQWGAISLARVDGKSPLEYLANDNEKNCLRAFGRLMLNGEMRSIAEVADQLAGIKP
ncbi:phosphotransferase [Candidatus Sumerlaeota bacterium]|nr:phosphotransferase [Candidatus Sumerlaeota bacterium]